MPTPSQLSRRLTTFCLNALRDGHALDAKQHLVTPLGAGRSLISWDCIDPPDLSSLSIEKVENYIFFLENGHYSIVCNDGSLVQMSFKIYRGRIVNHRLAYIPCPVTFDPVELVERGLDEVVIEAILGDDLDRLSLRGVVRFDFDPNAESDDHPASHLTLNYDETRIPVSRTFDASTFIRFIDENFLEPRKELGRLNVKMARDNTSDVLRPDHLGRPHFHWNDD